MTQRRRRQLGRGYTEEFNLLEAGVSSLDLSMRLEAIWSSPGRGQDLDDLTSGGAEMRSPGVGRRCLCRR
jgi:hypothetical protein